MPDLIAGFVPVTRARILARPLFWAWPKNLLFDVRVYSRVGLEHPLAPYRALNVRAAFLNLLIERGDL
jgi:hypothetical protein